MVVSSTYNSIAYEKKSSGDFSFKAFKTAEKFLDLGSPKDILMSDLNSEERAQSLKILAKMMKEGIIGYRYYIVDGKVEKHFIENELVDRRLANAKPVKIFLPEGGVLV
jgi:hypothetical protein